MVCNSSSTQLFHCKGTCAQATTIGWEMNIELRGARDLTYSIDAKIRREWCTPSSLFRSAASAVHTSTPDVCRCRCIRSKMRLIWTCEAQTYSAALAASLSPSQLIVCSGDFMFVESRSVMTERPSTSLRITWLSCPRVKRIARWNLKA